MFSYFSFSIQSISIFNAKLLFLLLFCRFFGHGPELIDYQIRRALNFDLNPGTMTSDNVNRGIFKPYELKISE